MKNNLRTFITPATEVYLSGLLYRNTRTSCQSLARLSGQLSHDTLRRVLYRAVPWSRRLWEWFAAPLVRGGGSLILDDTSWRRFTRVAEAVSWVWSSSLGKPVWGMQVVVLVWTDGAWKVPIGFRLWQKGGPSKGELAVSLLAQARRRGLPPEYVLFDSWYGAAQVGNLLDAWGWHYIDRLKRNRLFAGQPLRRTWPHRYGQACGSLRKVYHSVLVVKDGRRYWVTNDRALTPRQGKASYANRQLIEETFRLLKQECGWGSCTSQHRQAQWAHLHLGVYALCLTQAAAPRRHQTIYAFRQTLFTQRLPQKLPFLQEFSLAA